VLTPALLFSSHARLACPLPSLRFTLDTNNYIKAMRLFVGEPVWTPHNRPQESHPARVTYVASLGGDADAEVVAPDTKRIRKTTVEEESKAEADEGTA